MRILRASKPPHAASAKPNTIVTSSELAYGIGPLQVGTRENAEERVPERYASHIAQWESLCRGKKVAILRIVLIFGHDLFKSCNGTIHWRRCGAEHLCHELVCSSRPRANGSGGSAFCVDSIPSLLLNVCHDFFLSRLKSRDQSGEAARQNF